MIGARPIGRFVSQATMSRTQTWRGVRIHTIGHSTLTLDELVERLRAFGVALLADIRTIPRSRHNPQFNADALRAALPGRGLRYVHLARLGGLRRARADSPNTGWRNASFRGFADYMQSADFEAGLAELRALAAEGAVAVMCAETVPWRCHRSLVADALVARGADVQHITGAARASPHRLTPFAEVHGARVAYPAGRAAGAHLATRGPFHLETTVRVLQRRPSNRVDLWEAGRYRRLLATAAGLALVEVENAGTLDDPDLRCAILGGEASPAAEDGVERILRKVLGLDVHPESLQRLAAGALRPTVRALRGLRPPRFAGWFEAFANVVPFQQLSVDAGAAIVGRLVERFGEHLEHDGRRYHAFPTAPAVAGARLESLRACGLSARKAEALRALARAIAAGELSEAAIAGLSTGEALRALGALPGIGPWSAALLLLRGLGWLDVFPPGDVGAVRGLGALLRLAPGPALDRVVERCGAQRGYLYFCALAESLRGKGLIHAAPPPARAARPGPRGPAA